jgi:hypothetical protein
MYSGAIQASLRLVNIVRMSTAAGKDLRSDTHTADQSSNSKHTVLNRSSLQYTANRENNDRHDNRVLPAQLVRKVPSKQGTDESSEFKHSSHEAFPETGPRRGLGDSRERLKELVHDKRD